MHARPGQRTVTTMVGSRTPNGYIRFDQPVAVMVNNHLWLYYYVRNAQWIWPLFDEITSRTLDSSKVVKRFTPLRGCRMVRVWDLGTGRSPGATRIRSGT